MHLKSNTRRKSLEELDHRLGAGWGDPQQNSSHARQDLGSIHEIEYGLVPLDSQGPPVSAQD